jgi:predicted RecB family endonuclease
MLGRKQAMVVLASEQLWPNLHGLVHWMEHEGGLTDLCIYYTADEKRSGGPAQRFWKFCNQLYPKLRVYLPSGPLDITPDAVRGQIRRWQTELPDRHWVINATGGLKLMSVGAMECAELPDTEVVYRELSGQWFRVSKTPDGLAVRPFQVDPSETDAISVQHLVPLQFDAPSDAWWTMETPQPLPILELVRQGIQNRWNWKAMFAACGLDSSVQSGFLFERFVAACLLELGIRQIAMNLILQRPHQVLQEIDIAANHRGRLLIIDCKLRTRAEENKRVETLTSQIRQAYTTARQLGGLGAQLLLVRPGRAFSEEETQLAKTLGLQILDRGDTLEFFRKLAAFCNLQGPLPDQLQKAQEELDRAKAAGSLEALAVSAVFFPPMPSEEPLQTVLPVSNDLQQLMQQLGQDWTAYEIDGRVWIRGRIPSFARGQTCQEYIYKKLQKHLPSYATVTKDNIWISTQKTTYCVCLELPSDSSFLTRLRQHLAQFVGKNLLGS